MNSWTLIEHLQRLQRRVKTRLDPALAEVGLAPSAAFLLAAAERCPYPTDLAQMMALPPPTVSRLLKDLELGGYLARETVPEDLRRYRFRLTPAGEAVKQAARDHIEQVVDRMLQRLTPAERDELDRLMAILTDEGDGANGN